MRVTEKCDVYSFGVVALEVMMGKHPGELISSLSTKKILENDLDFKDVLDQRILPPTGTLADEVMFAVNAAVACTHSTPDSRPTMRFVAQELSARIQTREPEKFGLIKLSKSPSLQNASHDIFLESE